LRINRRGGGVEGWRGKKERMCGHIEPLPQKRGCDVMEKYLLLLLGCKTDGV